jgi:PIN domain nuclease of toxin-antitoxin system
MGQGIEAVILDTHAWVFYATGRPIPARSLRRIERSRREGELHVAAVTLWEVALLAHEGRLMLAQPAGDWMRDALRNTSVRVAALDAGVAVEGARLLRVLRDPADCQIVGTALHHGVPLATRDGRIVEHAKALALDIVPV